MYRTLKVLGYDIFVDDISSIEVESHAKKVISTINAYSYVTAQNDRCFDEALRASDAILPDGGSFVLAAKHTVNQPVNRVAGADLHTYLLKKLNANKGSCFYLGASQDTLDIIREKLSHNYPNIVVGSYSPPFKEQFTDKDNNKMISQVNAFNPDVLFIGMTAPKQEKWIIEHRDKLNFKIAVPIGAVFDFYAGNVKRAPLWMQKNHLEWLHRGFSSWRLAKRYLSSNPAFIMAVYRHKKELQKYRHKYRDILILSNKFDQPTLK
ncbi:MAG: WecB/TagA/CpsF family glycosyltransferase [Cocleimonas sp.]